MSKIPTRRRYSLFPKTLGQFIEPLTRPVLKTQGLAGTRILTEWRQIVGAELAAHAVPEKLSFPQGKKTGGTLTVAVENGFATAFQHEQHMILERLASYFGYKAVTRVIISHSFAHETPKNPFKTAKNSSKTAQNSQKIDQKLCDSVADPELKAALESFAQSLNS